MERCRSLFGIGGTVQYSFTIPYLYVGAVGAHEHQRRLLLRFGGRDVVVGTFFDAWREEKPRITGMKFKKGNIILT